MDDPRLFQKGYGELQVLLLAGAFNSFLGFISELLELIRGYPETFGRFMFSRKIMRFI